MVEDSGFGQRAKPTAIIRNILDTYPFSVGIFRELLQNSDDAGADEQVFLLDHRSHSAEALISTHLSHAQGPALLAFNDASFQSDDWIALQNISESSKRSDTSKIGKYGIGFRSCYHVTDTPQILSDHTLAVFDPHHSFSSHGGVKKDLTFDPHMYADHIRAMNLDIFRGTSVDGSFKGTVIRLPLRRDGSKSEISPKTLTPMDIRQLFHDFVDEELEIAMLFLTNVRSISLMEVDDFGVRVIGKAHITKPSSALDRNARFIRQEAVSVSLMHGPNEGEAHISDWFVVHNDFTMAECSAILSERLRRDCIEDLRREKLSPSVSLAFPIPLIKPSQGRLFTYLPLPLPTGFPCHVHSLFALTPSRQNLRNAVETGMVHGARDELLVEWNKVLFDKFIPRSWAEALELLVHTPFSANVWLAWPPVSQETPGGDPSYWRHLLRDTVRALVDEQRPVWPLVNQDSFAHLSDALLATSLQDTLYFAALTAAGVHITAPPSYIVEVISKTGLSCNELTPYNAYQALSNDHVHALNSPDKDIIRDFLLSTGDAALVANLPVIRMINGTYVALSRKASSPDTEYVLLGEDEVAVFQSCTDNLICSNQFTASFVSSAPGVLNVVLLGCSQVVSLIDAATVNLEHSARLLWLRRFWSWLSTWSQRDQLYSLVTYHILLIDSDLGFHPLNASLFMPEGISDDVQMVLHRMGLLFLDPSFPPTAAAYLRAKGFLKSVSNISELLSHLQPNSKISQTEAVHLAKHISLCLTSYRWRFSDGLRRCLRMLPVFPILTPYSLSSATVPAFGSVQPGSQLVVCDTGNVIILKHSTTILLPVVPNVTFIARYHASLDTTTLASFADTSFRNQLSENDVVDLGITHFTSQTRAFQATFLRQVITYRRRLPPQSIQNLGRTPFVLVQTGHSKAPQDVVDPNAAIASLFDAGDARLPHVLDSDGQVIINSLSSLQLLQDVLSDDIIRERLHTINDSSSSEASRQCAVELLRHLEDSRYPCSHLRTELQLSWLPTSKGLRRPTECRDQTKRCNRALFDKVLDILASPVDVTSSSLREALGWDHFIPLEIINKQLDAVLRLRPGSWSGDVSVILIELGRRLAELESSPESSQNLRAIASDEVNPWIPTTDHSYSTISRTLLGGDPPPPGFKKVASSLLFNEGVGEVLSILGCSHSATNKALLEELHALGSGQLLAGKLKDALRLLKALDLSTLPEHEREQLPIPDVNAHIRPLSQIYFDDLGADVYEVELPEGRTKAHNEVKARLVDRLGIEKLSSLGLKRVELDDEDMYEDLTTRISNVLRQYALNQAPNEFLANAVDAGATQYNLMLDRRRYSTHRVLSQEMIAFQTSPALIVHNNAKFSDNDWKGIRQVGLGGKLDHVDAIGRFGLGALSMFHFTEVPMVVSGSYIMFLDPGRQYLPPHGRRARNHLRVPISHMRKHHPDHLATIHGVKGYDLNMDHFNGTIFRLPLRTSSQAAKSLLSQQPLDESDVRSLLQVYGSLAAHSILNIPVDLMQTSMCDYTGLHPLWTVKATRQQLEMKNAVPEGLSCEQATLEFISSTGVRKVEKWHRITETVMLETLPQEFSSLTLNHKMRQRLTVSLAGCVLDGHRNKDTDEIPRGRLYSRLPLPTLTSLPIHIDAPFIIAEDRRSVRFEESGQLNIESRYNHWLLSDKVPRLYASLLEAWPVAENRLMWPGASQADRDSDPISRVVIKAFYNTHFASFPQKFCHTLSGSRLAPTDAHFLRAESDEVMSIISLLRPATFVKLPSRIRLTLLPPGLRPVDADALHDTLAINAERILSLYRDERIEARDLDALLTHMLREQADSVVGLKILPLADHSLGTVQRGSSEVIFARSDPSRMSEEVWASIFPLHRFLHPAVRSSTSNLTALAINVKLFNASHAVKLLEEIIPPAAVATLNSDQQVIVKSFLNHIDKLDISLANHEIRSIPLVPTSKIGTYISLSFCQPSNVLALPDHSYLVRILQSMGSIHLINTSDCSPALKGSLSSISPTFDAILNIFEQHGLPQHVLPERATVQPGDHDKFAEYARHQVLTLRVAHTSTTGNKKNRKKITTFTVNHLQIARSLPIWKAQCDGRSLFLPANHASLCMLPRAVPLSVVSQFLAPLGTFIDFDSSLNTVLGVQSMTYPSLHASLHLPLAVTPQHLPRIKEVLKLFTGSGITSMKVPNTFGTMVESSTLFAYTNLIFRAAFETNPHKFLHPGLRDMESSLASIGFNNVMTLSSFVQCARAIDREAAQSVQSQGASTVFSYYNDHLWNLVIASPNSQDSWRSLDDLSFIPRSDARRNYANRLDHVFFDYARPMPQIVSPNNVLRPGCEAVAWTQRALSDVALSEHLLVAHPSLGVPTVEEVTEHLRTLKMIADRYPHNGNLINDFTETYQWLNNRADDSRPHLLAYADEQLFLNVNNPNISWTFSTANQLVFNGRDEGRRQRIRTFLMPFKRLLLSVGALEVTDAVRPALELSSAEEALYQWRNTSNQYRLNQKMTDVLLVSSDGKKFHAHRLVLSVESQYFEAMLSGRWDESVPLMDVTGRVLEHILEFIYTRNIPFADLDDEELFDHQDDLIEVLEICHLWNLPALFKVVENQLIATISLGTYQELEELAIRFDESDLQAAALRDACVDFRTKNALVL